MDDNLLLPPASKKRCNRIFREKKHSLPIFSNKTQETGTTSTKEKFKCYIAHLEEHCVVVTDAETIKRLYTTGFFGKGTLSRSTPRVCLEPRKPKEAVEITSASEDEHSTSDSEVEKENKDEKEENSCHNDASDDITEVMDSAAEQLQLTFEEAFFLSYALGCLVVMDKEQPMDLQRLWQKFCDQTPDMRFPVMYTAYHHFRSKGWIPRSGLKYGCDFVLYKDGPPYYHSTYCVIVKSVKEKLLKETYHNKRLQLTWASLAATNRVVTQTAKGLMFLYVIKPELMSENKIVTPFCISKFKLQEVLVKRWVPSSERGEENC